jgi:NACalpha-BTF3-like transcription factor
LFNNITSENVAAAVDSLKLLLKNLDGVDALEIRGETKEYVFDSTSVMGSYLQNKWKKS